MKKLVLLVGLSLLLVACGEVEETKEVAPVVEKVEKKEPVVAKVVEKKEPVVVKELTVNQKIEKAVVKAIGKDKKSKKKLADRIGYMDADKTARISLDANENLSNKLTKKGIWLDTKNVFKEIKDIEEVDLFFISWYLPLVDAYGNVEDGLVMAFEITREELQKINHDNFLIDNIPKIVTNYFEHPAFSK